MHKRQVKVISGVRIIVIRNKRKNVNDQVIQPRFLKCVKKYPFGTFSFGCKPGDFGKFLLALYPMESGKKLFFALDKFVRIT